MRSAPFRGATLDRASFAATRRVCLEGALARPCIFSVHLLRAFETGLLWRELRFLETEEDFSAVRSTAWFQDLVQSAKNEDSKTHYFRNRDPVVSPHSRMPIHIFCFQ
jgi:hypothetical protein